MICPSGFSTIMLRRSLRLQKAGYYTEEGTPCISYKENLYRIFRRRTNPFHDQHHMKNTDQCKTVGHDDSIADFPHEQNDSNNNDSGTSSWSAGTPATQTWTRGTQANPTQSAGTQATLTLNTGTQTIRIRGNKVRTTYSLCVRGFLLLLLALGLAHYTQTHLQMRELQLDVQSLTYRLNMFVPLVDTTANFALESQGARVLHHLSSDTHWPQNNMGIIWGRISYWLYSSKTQRRVIQGHSSLHPGQCWPFSGDRGHLFISLSHQVSITHVTLGHIAESQSPYGFITSAPREFSIYGMTSMDEKGTYLGTLVYDQAGAAYQTFHLQNPEVRVFRYVKLQVENNWGNIDHTCLYSFRVHGKLSA